MKMRNAEELMSFFNQATPGAEVNFDDLNYVLPTREWVTGDFARAMLGNLQKLGITYAPESFDCDKFAKLVAAFGAVCNLRTSGHKGGLALGVFYYRSPAGYHAINVAVVPDDDDLDLVFIEPQTGQELRLSEEELASCYRITL